MIWKNRRTGVWNLQWRRNDPIPHYSFEDAVATLINMLRLEIIWNTNKRGREARGDGNTGTGAA